MPPSLRRVAAVTWLALTGCSEEVLAPREPIDALIITTATPTIVTGSGVQLGLLVFGVSGQLVLDEPSSWSSDRPGVASVSSTGFVSGVTPGIATITATAGGKTNTIVMLVLLASCSSAEGDTLTLGGSVNGSLTARPCFLQSNFIAQGHVLRITEAGSIQADIISAGFSPSLVLTTAFGSVVRSAHSNDGESASLRSAVLPGTYILWAAALGRVSQQSSYGIAVSSAAGACGASPAASLAVGEARSLALSASSCLLLNGPVAEGWRMSLDAPTRVRLVAASPDFPPMVAITDAQLEVVSFAQRSAAGTVELTWLLEPGQYRVWAGSFWSSAGRLDVSLEEIDICAATLPLAFPGVVNGTFAAGDCLYDRWLERFADAYLLTLPAPTAVQLDLTSADADPYLFITTVDGAPLAEDDDSGNERDARLVIDLPAGTYRVWATTWVRGATGSYALSATTAAAGARSLQRTTSAPRANPWVPITPVPK